MGTERLSTRAARLYPPFMTSLPASSGGASLPWRLVFSSLRRLPQGSLSRLFGLLADTPLPLWARSPVIGTLARMVGAEVEEAEKPLTAYVSVNAFFARHLRSGARRWPSDPELLVAPTDGVFGAVGRIENGTLIQAKGIHYTATELLGGDEEQAAIFEGGHFVTIYLAPRNYHRIHTPLPGHVVRARHIPGRLLPVNIPAVNSIEGLFSQNERLICTVAGALGPIAIAAVGAYNVGRISTAFDPTWSGRVGGWITNRGTPPPALRSYPHPIPVTAGDELMAFHLGSTVVILVGPEIRLAETVVPGRSVQVGEIIGGREPTRQKKP